MILRNMLLVLGLLAALAGAALSMFAASPLAFRTAPPDPAPLRQEILVAARPIETGALLRLEDMAWQAVAPGTTPQGGLLRGETGIEAMVGAVARRDFAAGEPLFASALVRPGERGFLAAVLAPGHRAVSVPVDAPQSAAGLMLPGDHVDVILTQNFNDAATEPARRSVGETILPDLRVIAVDQRISASAPIPGQPGEPAGARLPRTVTLEVSPEQAQALFVATQLGRIELALRSLANSAGAARAERSGRVPPTWAADVSPVLRGVTPRPVPPPANVPASEHTKIEVMHGAKTELR